MRRAWQRTQRGLKGLFLVALILASCSSQQQGCGGTEAAVACLDVVSVVPTDSSNVDAFADICTRDATTGAILTVEHLTDHTADVTFSNTKLPTVPASASTVDLVITGYTITYTRNGPCPSPSVAQACPPIAPLSFQETIVLPADSTVTRALPLVPLTVKVDYASNFDPRLPVPVLSYTAHYVFTVRPARVGSETFTVAGDTQFEIGDFLVSSTCGPI